MRSKTEKRVVRVTSQAGFNIRPSREAHRGAGPQNHLIFHIHFRSFCRVKLNPCLLWSASNRFLVQKVQDQSQPFPFGTVPLCVISTLPRAPHQSHWVRDNWLQPSKSKVSWLGPFKISQYWLHNPVMAGLGQGSRNREKFPWVIGSQSWLPIRITQGGFKGAFKNLALSYHFRGTVLKSLGLRLDFAILKFPLVSPVYGRVRNHPALIISARKQKNSAVLNLG